MELPPHPFHGLIAFSGGMDSSALVYNTLSQHPNQRFLVFRLHLVNSRSAGRQVMERRAAEQFMAALAQEGRGNFDFRRLEFHCDALGTPVWDNEAVNFAAATCIQAHPSIETYYEGMTAQDARNVGFQERLAKRSALLRLMTGKDEHQLDIRQPLIGMEKAGVVSLLPEHFRRLTWSCRFPQPDPNSWDMKPCGTCEPCLALAAC